MSKKESSASDKKAKNIFQSIFKESKVASFLLKDFVFIDCNDEILKLFKCSKDSLIGETPYYHSPEKQPDEQSSEDKAKKLISSALNKNPTRFFWIHKDVNSKLFNVEVSLSKLNVGDSYTIAIIHQTDDFSGKESEVIKDLSYFKVLFENAPDAYYILSMGGKFIYGNKKVKDLTGYNRDELIGKDFRKVDFIKGIDRVKSIKLFAKNILGIEPEPFEMKIYKKSGEVTEIELHTSIIKFKGKRRILGIGRDITKRKALERTAQKEKERFLKYLDVAGSLILILDKSANIKLINQTGANILGYKKKHLLGKNWFSFIPEVERDSVKNTFAKIINGEGKEYKHFNNHVISKDNEKKSLYWNNVLLRDQAGDIKGVLCSGDDITQLKETEQRLKQEVRFIDKVMESIPGIFYVFSENWEIDNWNTNLQKVTGYTEKEISNLTVFELFDSTKKEIIKKKFKNILDGKDGGLDTNLVTREGNQIPYYLTGERFIIDEKKHIVGVGIDMKALKETENQLKARERLFKLTFDNVGVGIKHVDLKGKIINTNKKLYKMLGYSKEELIGKNLNDITYKPDIESELNYFKKISESHLDTYETEKRLIRKNGELLWVRLVLTPYVSNSDEVEYIIGLVTDISREKKATKKLKQKILELKKINKLMVGREVKMSELKKQIKKEGR